MNDAAPDTIVEALEVTASRFPSRPALRQGPSLVTYGELWELASAVAANLGRRGIAPGSKVGVLAPKTVETVALLYGVLLSGAAYVPLSVDWPRTMVMSALADVRADLVVCGGASTDESGSTGAAWVPLAELLRPEANSGSTKRVGPSDSAYILYTSGSTGRPRGVRHTHQSALAFARWAHVTFGVDFADVLGSHAPLSFDLTTFDLFAAVLAGACVELLTSSEAAFTVGHPRLIRERQITIWYSVPSVFAGWLGRGERPDFKSLRWVLFAGEPAPPNLIADLKSRLPESVRLANLFGPTETNVCLWHELVGDVDVSRSIPIGSPITSDTLVWLDGDGLDDGSAELLVSGPTVMSGYCGIAPSKTFEEAKGARWYRTGDVVTVRNDGRLDFVGRRDWQVKINGHRVEPLAVELALLTHAQVREAAVVLAPDGRSLHGFVGSDCELTEAELHDHVAARVPKRAVPTAWTRLPALPRDARGKIARAALVDLCGEAS